MTRRPCRGTYYQRLGRFPVPGEHDEHDTQNPALAESTTTKNGQYIPRRITITTPTTTCTSLPLTSHHHAPRASFGITKLCIFWVYAEGPGGRGRSESSSVSVNEAVGGRRAPPCVDLSKTGNTNKSSDCHQILELECGVGVDPPGLRRTRLVTSLTTGVQSADARNARTGDEQHERRPHKWSGLSLAPWAVTVFLCPVTKDDTGVLGRNGSHVPGDQPVYIATTVHSPSPVSALRSAPRTRAGSSCCAFCRVAARARRWLLAHDIFQIQPGGRAARMRVC
jgi:hypothetical protein